MFCDRAAPAPLRTNAHRLATQILDDVTTTPNCPVLLQPAAIENVTSHLIDRWVAVQPMPCDGTAMTRQKNDFHAPHDADPEITLAALAAQLAAGETSSAALVQSALARGEQEGVENVFTQLDVANAQQQELEQDALRADGRAPSRWAGIPITVKDLFDLAGQTTMAGSRVLSSRAPASANAPAIQHLLDAGFVVLGKVNMTEFAYSGLGLNAHYGTPVNPWSGEMARIPGGSSSGAGASVAGGIVPASIGTDTGGSVRIPAALCHLVGFKPPSAAVSTEGAVPLSATLDSVGPLANSVACCRVLASIMSAGHICPSTVSGEAASLPPLSGRRLLLPVASSTRDCALWRQLDPQVQSRFEQSVQRLVEAGVEIIREPVPLFDDVLESGVQGTIVGFESSQWHREMISHSADQYDPRVLSRMLGGFDVTDEAYKIALAKRDVLIDRFAGLMKDFDAVIWPTTAIVAPTFDELQDDKEYGRINQLMLRNTSIGNTLDSAAVTIPLPITAAAESTADSLDSDLDSDAETLLDDRDRMPAGFMLLQSRERCDHLLAVAESLEPVIRYINL